jgi:methyl-accepting chemotaxis protein
MAIFGNKAVQHRVEEAVNIIDKISSGDFSSSIDTSGSDVVVPIMRALKKSQATLERRITDGRRTTDASGDQQELLNLVADYLERIAQGDIPTKITTEQKDDTGTKIKKSLNKIISTLNGFQDSINYVADEHAAGDIDVVIDTNMFNGSFRGMAQAINDLVAGHIAVKKKAMACIKEFSEGNFDAPMERLPGKKAFITDTIEKLRGNVKSFIADMNNMSDEHDKGDIDVVIDTSKFQGAYKDMAVGVNAMVNGHIAVKKKAMATIKAFGEGNFDAPLEQFPGKKAFINDTIEKVRGNLKGFIADMKHMSTEHDKGDIDVVMDVDRFQGDFKAMAQGVNNMVNGHIAVKKKAMACIKGFGEGDFNAPLEQFPGKKAFINDTIEKVRGNLKNLIADMQNMSAEHDRGDIDVVMNVNSYLGDYKTMAQGVNDMVNGHIAVKKKAMAVIKEFGEGNFDAPLEKFPGKKVFINNTIEQVRTNLQALIADTDMLAQASLDGRIQVRAEAQNHQGDFRRIIEGINSTLESIVTPIITVKASIDSISTATKEISSGNADLSHRTEQQAASLEETASSMEELASTVKQNSENAKQANHLAMTASDVAVKGGSMVQQVVDTMYSINESSRKIVDIISVIDGIALQTNILALNAAVEAARAGEQGRGFAVVASEVRNLAQRSAAAAKEIKELIGNSVEKVEDGSKLVGEAGKTMDEIVSSVKRVTDIMADIAAASVEQSAGIDQVNKAVNQMDEVTQQNAALVEQAAAAAESLEEQAQTLSDTVAQFRLDSDIRSPAPRRAVAQHKAPVRTGVVAAKPQRVDSSDEWSEF